MKKILIISMFALLLTGCGDVELENGEKAIVSFNNGDGVSAQELYDELKDMYGVNYLVNLIDTKLLNLEYEETTEELEYVQQVVDSVKAESGEEFISYIEYYYGVNSEQAFEDYIRLNYRRSLWIEDYAKDIVTDKQIEEYYNDVYVGDMEVSHILITVDATADTPDDEKKEAETEAYNKAKEIIEKLNNGEDFATLAKENSDDTATANEGGAVGTVNYGMNYDEDFVEATNKNWGTMQADDRDNDESEAVIDKAIFSNVIMYKCGLRAKDISVSEKKKADMSAIAEKEKNIADCLYKYALEASRGSEIEKKVGRENQRKAYNDSAFNNLTLATINNYKSSLDYVDPEKLPDPSKDKNIVSLQDGLKESTTTKDDYSIGAQINYYTTQQILSVVDADAQNQQTEILKDIETFNYNYFGQQEEGEV